MRNMKYLLVAALCAAMANAEAPAEVPPHWQDTEKGEVLWFPRYTLSVRLTELAADEEVGWAQLDLRANTEAASLEAQRRELQVAYPQLTPRRAFAQMPGEQLWEVSVPGWTDKVQLRARLNSDGLPYAESTLYLSKAQYLALKTAAPSYTLNANVRVSVPSTQVLDSIELDESYCRRLLPKDGTLLSLVSHYPEVAAQIERLGRYPQTREMAKTALLQQCGVLEEPAQLRSFAELLALRVNGQNTRVRAEYKRRVDVNTDFALPFELRVHTPGEER